MPLSWLYNPKILLCNIFNQSIEPKCCQRSSRRKEVNKTIALSCQSLFSSKTLDSADKLNSVIMNKFKGYAYEVSFQVRTSNNLFYVLISEYFFKKWVQYVILSWMYQQWCWRYCFVSPAFIQPRSCLARKWGWSFFFNISQVWPPKIRDSKKINDSYAIIQDQMNL